MLVVNEWIEFPLFMVAMILLSFLVTGILYLGILFYAWLLENPNASDEVVSSLISYLLLISIVFRALFRKQDKKK